MMDRDYKNFCNHLIVNDEIFYKKVGDKIELYSYGCPDSIWDLETIAQCIDQEKLEDSLIFVDTCCAIDLQENVSKSVVDRITSIYPDKTIYITGCGVEYDREFYKDKGFLLDNKEKFSFETSYKNIVKKQLEPLNTNHINGFVKISDGCSYNCAYCAIKNVRHHRMFSYEEISQQIQKNIEANIYEVCLFGTEICSYNYKGLNLTRLIKKLIIDFPQLTSIKLDTIHPGFNDIDNLIALIHSEDRLPKELDLGIQSCSDTMLKLMRRTYNVERIRHIVELGKGLDINFQLIVGFPGETNELFSETLTNLKDLAPDRITLCPFSARKNTEAATMENKVPRHIAEEREHKLVMAVKQSSNQEIEKKSIAEFNSYKPIDIEDCIVYHADLYNKEEFVSIFKKIRDIKTNKDIVVYCTFDPYKEIKELSTNIKLLILTFGVKVITKFKINDDTIKINYPRLLTNDLLTFVEFEFDKLEKASVDDVITFITDIKECNIDCNNLVSRLGEAGNKKLLRMALNRI